MKREVGGSVKAVVTRLGVGQEEEVGMDLEKCIILVLTKLIFEGESRGGRNGSNVELGSKEEGGGGRRSFRSTSETEGGNDEASIWP